MAIELDLQKFALHALWGLYWNAAVGLGHGMRFQGVMLEHEFSTEAAFDITSLATGHGSDLQPLQNSSNLSLF